MEGFLDALYGYTQEKQMASYLETCEYRRLTFDLEENWTAFRSTLTAEQDRKLESLLNQERSVKRLEEQAVFQSALSIGTGLGRL